MDANQCPAQDPSDNDDSETVTMLDVLQEEQDLEDNAFAVLAGSDDQNCTYLKGYVSRQALYACLTCQRNATTNEQTDRRAAICLACSYRCHDGHELIELYTKRNFRCDCGNDKFPDDCKLCPKSSLNESNQYNHNFDGLYCICLRPYPDPDNDIEDQMIQCVVCEDWLHGRHLENLPENEDFAEMVCKKCMNKLPFLWYYNKSYANNVIAKEEKIDKEVDIVSNESKGEETVKGETSVASESDSGVETSCDSVDVNECKLRKIKSVTGEEAPQDLMPTYWPMEWRRNLCKCSLCTQTYSENKCLFLTDDKDMVHYYETQGIDSNTKISHYDKGLSELNKMNRIQQIELLSGYNDLKNSLQEYLRKFADNKKTVRQEDIKEFFEQMASRKRQRVDIPYHCK